MCQKILRRAMAGACRSPATPWLTDGGIEPEFRCRSAGRAERLARTQLGVDRPVAVSEGTRAVASAHGRDQLGEDRQRRLSGSVASDVEPGGPAHTAQLFLVHAVLGEVSAAPRLGLPGAHPAD